MKQYISFLCLSLLIAQPVCAVNFDNEPTTEQTQKPKLSRKDVIKIIGGVTIVAALGTLGGVGIWYATGDDVEQPQQSKTQTAPVQAKPAVQTKSNKTAFWRRKKQQPQNTIVASKIIGGLERVDAEIEALQNMPPAIAARFIGIGQRIANILPRITALFPRGFGQRVAGVVSQGFNIVRGQATEQTGEGQEKISAPNKNSQNLPPQSALERAREREEARSTANINMASDSLSFMDTLPDQDEQDETPLDQNKKQ